MNLGLQYKEAGMTHRDPFQRVQQLEEACKMFNKVLELKPHDETARRHMGECCTAMNSDYQRMKGIKKMDKVGVEQGRGGRDLAVVCMAGLTGAAGMRVRSEWNGRAWENASVEGHNS